MMTKKSTDLKFTTEGTLPTPKTQPMGLVNARDWQRLRRLVDRFSTGIGWGELWMGFVLSSMVSIWIAYLATPNSQPLRVTWFWIGWISILVVALSLVLLLNVKHADAVTKVEINDELDLMEEDYPELKKSG